MEILWLLMTAALLGVLVTHFLRRGRGGGIRLAEPGSPDAADPAAYGFARQEDLDVRLPGPDQDLVDVVEHLERTQEWQVAAQLLATTPKEGELRWQRVASLAGAAALALAQQPGAGGRWLREWRIAAPKDAGGAAVHAEFLVQQAWRNQGEDRRILLEEARAAVAEAALLAPGDPVPYVVDLNVARGLGDARAEFDQLWLKILDRDPAHMGAHLAALHYWCEKWHGSRKDALAFAEAAAARAPQGSLLAALPLFAEFESIPEVMGTDIYASASIRRAVAGALHTAHAARPDNPALPHVRHLLIHFLIRGDRWSEAMHQIVAVDGFVGALPWTHSPDPAAAYALERALAVAGYEANGGSPARLMG
ncbi:hypothetical protein [Streptomyces sp. NPDC060194]|uniref:hypothetical protein n=1 Tax=Streptomyces sp. NPDC060194 TaxID=3347069 RepID=UPI00365315A3